MEKDDNADNLGVKHKFTFIFCIFSYFVFKLYLIVDFTTLRIL